MENEKIIDKIRKLEIQSQSAKKIGNEEEALAFAEKVQKLMAQYQVEMSQLEIKEEPIYVEHIPWNNFGHKFVNRRQSWIELLSYLVAKQHSCKIVVYPKTNIIKVYGTEINRKIAIHIIGSIVTYINTLANKEYSKFYYECKKTNELHLAKGFKKSFLFGFIKTLQDRYEQMSDERALQVIGKELIRVEEYMKDMNFGKASQLNNNIYNYDGFQKGQEAGNTVDINRQDNRIESQ